MKVSVNYDKPQGAFDPRKLAPGTLFEWLKSDGTWLLCVKMDEPYGLNAMSLEKGLFFTILHPFDQYRPFHGVATVSNEEKP